MAATSRDTAVLFRDDANLGRRASYPFAERKARALSGEFTRTKGVLA
jgi:hypothetical protein